MTEPTHRHTEALGEIDPAGSRQRGRRSAIVLTTGVVVTGTADGRLVAHDRKTGAERWRTVLDDGAGHIVTLATADGFLLAGTRGPAGQVTALNPATGEKRWHYRTADDVGGPTKDSRFYLPFVVDAVAANDKAYVAARRYERRPDDDHERHFESTIYAFENDGAVAWRYEADASPIALDARDDRLAVGYNRCTGAHQLGLVVLDASTGVRQSAWNPDTDSDRRIGDVSLVSDGVVVGTHSDYRGYALDRDGEVRWRVALGTAREIGDERLYAYPNHVHATDAGVCFVTGNTYPTEGREAAGRHPNEHTAFGIDHDGTRCWSADVGGFAHGIATDGDRLAVPVAQHFRDRDATKHGLRVFDVAQGRDRTIETDGIVTAAALDAGTVSGVEEPVVYHDEGREHGVYQLHTVDAEQ